MEAGIKRKRKATVNHGQGELSKRLKQLNLERDGQTLHIPITTPTSPPPKPHPPHPPPLDIGDDFMNLDNTKYKVYIHNIDDELSSSDESCDDGKLIFLPDIEKKIRSMQIPHSVLADGSGDLAGRSANQQLVLYNIPSSLSVPEEKDSVRKAIIETRARARSMAVRTDGGGGLEDAKGGGTGSGSVGIKSVLATATTTATAPFLSAGPGGTTDVMVEDDPDAMDLC